MLDNFVYKSILKGCKDKGIEFATAQRHAEAGRQDYNNNNFNPKGIKKKNLKPIDLIEQRIEMAKKDSK